MVPLIDLLFTPACSGCGLLGQHLCGSCRKAIQPKANFEVAGLDSLVVVAEYGGWVRDALISFKNGSKKHSVGLSELLHAGLENLGVTGPQVFVPIPTSQQKRRERGFDTVTYLVNEMCNRHTMVDCKIERLSIKVGIQDQVGLSAPNRRRNLADAFRATKVISNPVVIFDDVVTTGATFESAAKAVRLAGANSVSAIAICGSTNWR